MYDQARWHRFVYLLFVQLFMEQSSFQIQNVTFTHCVPQQNCFKQSHKIAAPVNDP